MYKLGRLKTLVYRMTKRWSASTRSLYPWMFICCLLLILHVLSLLLSSVRWSEHTPFLFLLWFSLDSVVPWLGCSTWTSCKKQAHKTLVDVPLCYQPTPFVWLNRTPSPLRKPQAFERRWRHGFRDSGQNFMPAQQLDWLASGCNSLLRTLVCSSWSVSAEWIHFATIIVTQIW